MKDAVLYSISDDSNAEFTEQKPHMVNFMFFILEFNHSLILVFYHCIKLLNLSQPSNSGPQQIAIHAHVLVYYELKFRVHLISLRGDTHYDLFEKFIFFWKNTLSHFCQKLDEEIDATLVSVK